MPLYRLVELPAGSACALLIAVLCLSINPLHAQTGKPGVASVASAPDARTFVVSADMLRHPNSYTIHFPEPRCAESREWRLLDAYGAVAAVLPKTAAPNIRMDHLAEDMRLQSGYFTWQDCQPAPQMSATFAGGSILVDESGTRLPDNGTPGGASVVVDVNGDGAADILRTASSGTSPFLHDVLLNTGDGRFEAALGAFPSELDSLSIRDLAATDLDGDGDIDLAIVASAGSAGLAIHRLFNDGSGRFQLEDDPVLGSINGFRLHADDLNGDTFPDLIVTCLITCEQVLPTMFDNPPVALLINSGGSGFVDATSMLEPDSTYGVVGATSADLNGDGRMDIVLSNQIMEFRDPNNNRIGVFSGQDAVLIQGDDGRFTDETFDRLPQSVEPTAWTLATDLDSDSDVDLFVLEGVFFDQYERKVLGNDGAGHFALIQSGPVGQGPATGLSAADFDGDSMTDVAFLSPSRLIILRNEGGVPEVFETTAAESPEPWIGFALGDVDGDQDVDVFVSVADSPDRLFINSTFLPTAGSDEHPGDGFELQGPFPNPATTSATLVITIHDPADVQISVVDILARRVWSHTKRVMPGRHVEVLDTSGLVAGTYLIRVETGHTATTKSLVVQ